MVAALAGLTRIIAGVSVPNTALINSSIALAQDNMAVQGFNHVMRAWLNGQVIINHLPREEQKKIDIEAFGVATILHDMGWAFNTSFVSEDKRFEVDGANAARDHVRQKGGKGWNKHRVQLIWDAIALHTTRDIASFKEIEVQLTSAGTLTELVGPENARRTWGDLITVTQPEWEAIAAEFPRTGMKGYFNETMITLCTQKQNTTFSNFVGDWGEEYVEGYTRVGTRSIDIIPPLLTE